MVVGASPAAGRATGAGFGAVAAVRVRTVLGSVVASGAGVVGATGAGVASTTGAGAGAGAGSATGACAVGASAGADFDAAAFFVAFAFAGSSGCTSRRMPSSSTLRRIRSACASSIDDEELDAPIFNCSATPSNSLLVSPSSFESSCTRIFFCAKTFPNLSAHDGEHSSLFFHNNCHFETLRELFPVRDFCCAEGHSQGFLRDSHV